MARRVKEWRCPFCGKQECTWTLSALAGPNSADVRTSCGQAFSVDALLGKVRWHVAAARRTLELFHPAEGEPSPPDKRQQS